MLPLELDSDQFRRWTLHNHYLSDMDPAKTDSIFKVLKTHLISAVYKSQEGCAFELDGGNKSEGLSSLAT